MIKNPCHACGIRFPACHSQCELYAEWRGEHERAKADKRRSGECVTMPYAVKKRLNAVKTR